MRTLLPQTDLFSGSLIYIYKLRPYIGLGYTRLWVAYSKVLMMYVYAVSLHGKSRLYDVSSVKLFELTIRAVVIILPFTLGLG